MSGPSGEHRCGPLWKAVLKRVGVPVAVAAALVVVWLAWPERRMLNPEPTGEIGFMGMVVIAKYAGYAARGAGALVLAALAFTLVVTGIDRLTRSAAQTASTPVESDKATPSDKAGPTGDRS